MKLGVLVSGELGFNLLKHLSIDNEIVFVMTDRSSQAVIDLCNRNSWSVYIGNPRDGRSKSFSEGKEIEVLVSVNYLFLIEDDLINLPKKLAFNVHGSLLPKYRGRTPHVWAIINNERETGISAHIIEKGCDTGAILEQVKIKIGPQDTGSSILNKFQKLYVPLVDSVLAKISSNNLQVFSQDESKATYFEKRTPEDGEINWNWQKERIKNLIRAQAFPYPGAFTHFKGEKIIIDEIEFIDDGFRNNMFNGQILSIKPLKIKTPNGVIQVKKIRNNHLAFQKGEILI